MSPHTVSPERLREQREIGEARVREIRPRIEELPRLEAAAKARGEDATAIREELAELEGELEDWKRILPELRALESEALEEAAEERAAARAQELADEIREAKVEEKLGTHIGQAAAALEGIDQTLERAGNLRALAWERELLGKLYGLELEPVEEPDVAELRRQLPELRKRAAALVAEAESAQSRHLRLHVEPVQNLSVEPPHPSSRNAFGRAKRLLNSCSEGTLAVAGERLREALQEMHDALPEDEKKLAGPRP